MSDAYFLAAEPLRIGNQVQLLADDWVIEDRWKLTRRVGRVTKYLKNPVLTQDRPWEDRAGCYPCVLHDADTGRYRMWYTCFNVANYFNNKGPGYYIAYAESEDGYTWTKPRLDGFPMAGHDKTNVVFTGPPGGWANASQVLLNPDSSNPTRRYLMVTVSRKAIELAASPDGLHWVREPVLMPFKSDFPNHLVWDEERALWLLYLRPPMRATGTRDLPEGHRHERRRLAVCASRNLRDWSMPRTCLYPDERSQPDYDMVYVFRRHGLFIGLYAEMFQETGRSEVVTHLATSRDGLRWERTWDREPLIPRGQPGSYDAGQVEPGLSPPIDMGSEMLFYYYASPSGQHDWGGDESVALCRLRRDRFMGQEAGEATGYLLTRQFVLEGSRLTINCSSPPLPYMKAGDGIRVAVVEAPLWEDMQAHNDRPVAGLTLEDCDPILTDDLEHVVTWRGSPDLGKVRGKPVYLRFQMRRASLFGFQVLP